MSDVQFRIYRIVASVKYFALFVVTSSVLPQRSQRRRKDHREVK